MMQKLSFVGNPVEVGATIQRMIRDGWTIDEDKPLTFYGFGALEVGFERDPTADQLQRDKAELEKPSRAEILAKARAAKAEKANKEVNE